QRLARSSSLCMVMVAWPLGRSLALAPCRPPFLFQLANLIANLGRPLIVFLLRRLVHFASQANQLRLLIGPSLMPAGPLANVLRLAVNVRDQRRQLALEIDIVVRATQATLIAELVK